ncbi:hypothetical protein RJG79_07610 [Mycoplasmatota bacterium WC44]
MSKSQNDPKEIRRIKDKGHTSQLAKGATKGRNAKKQNIKRNDV